MEEEFVFDLSSDAKTSIVFASISPLLAFTLLPCIVALLPAFILKLFVFIFDATELLEEELDFSLFAVPFSSNPSIVSPEFFKFNYNFNAFFTRLKEKANIQHLHKEQ